MTILNLLTIGIKTINRPLCLNNCLENIRKLYPLIKIIVGDDSSEKFKSINKEIITKYNADLIDIPYNSGLSIGRNLIVDAVKTKYFLTLDDDNYINENTKIIDILEFLEVKTDIDLVGGICPDRSKIYGNNASIYSYTFININKLDIFCCSNFIKISDRMNIYKTNLVLNLFIARTEIIKKNKWNPKLKFEEHKPFFIELYKNNITCAISYDFIFREIIDNRRDYNDNDSGYNKVNHNELYNLRIITSPILEKLEMFTSQYNNNNKISNFIEHILYINLPHRTDRDTETKLELDKLDVVYTKIDGVIVDDFPALGCSYAHINALEYAIKQNYKSVLICEDDICFKFSSSVIKQKLKQLYQDIGNNWDVILLTGEGVIQHNINNYDNLNKVIQAQTTSAYVVNHTYYKKLLNNFYEGSKLLKEHGKEGIPSYSIDQYWKKLQLHDKWFILNPRISEQRISYSDIEKRIVNYSLTE